MSALSAWKKSAPKRKGKKARLEMRPLKYLALQVARHREFQPFDSATITKGLWADMQYAFRRDWNECFIAEGGPGEGKSEFCLYWGKAWVSLTGGKLHYFWDIDEVPELNEGDFFHIDEWLFGEGTGKIKALNRLKNIWNTSRALQISSSVSTPRAPEIPFANYIATMLAQDTDAKTNVAEIRVPLPRVGLVYIGNAEVPLHSDEEFRKTYEAGSRGRKKVVIDEKGSKKIKPKFNLKDMADNVIIFAENENMGIKTKGQAESVFRAYQETYPVDDLGVDIANIANMILSRLDASKRPENLPDYQGQTANLQKALLSQLWDMGFENPAMKYLKDWCKYQKQDIVADKYEKQQGTISGALRRIRETGIGPAFEMVYSSKMKDEGKIVFGAPGNKPDPDLVFLTEDITEELKEQSKAKIAWWLDNGIIDKITEVYSLKCYIQGRPTVSIPRKELANSEIDLWANGKPLSLVYFDMISDQLFKFKVADQDRFTIRLRR